MAEQPGNRIPTYPQPPEVKWETPSDTFLQTVKLQPAEDAVNPKNGAAIDDGGLLTFKDEDGGANDWVSHPGTPESFNIDSNSLKWPATETARIAKRPS